MTISEQCWFKFHLIETQGESFFSAIGLNVFVGFTIDGSKQWLRSAKTFAFVYENKECASV